MRSTRRATTGEPTRLRAVPSVDSDTPHDEARGADAGPRHTPSPAEGGWEHALTSGLQSRAEKLVGAVLEGAEFSSESRPGPTELVELAVNVLRAAATSAGVPAEEAERQVAEALAYLRRRLTGDYVVDEFGFDEDYTVSVHLPLLRPLYQKWFRVEVRGIENIPDVGGALVVAQPLRHHRDGLAHDAGRRLRRAPAPPAPAHARRRPRLPDALHRHHGPPLRHHPGGQLRRGAAARAAASWSGSGPRGSRASASRSASATSCSASAAAASSRRRCAPACPIVPCSIVGAEEIYPILGNMPTVARLLGLPYAPITPTFPLLGPLGMVPLPSKWLIEFGPPIETTSFGARGGRRPDARLRPHRPGARDDPADALQPADAAQVRLPRDVHRDVAAPPSAAGRRGAILGRQGRPGVGRIVVGSTLVGSRGTPSVTDGSEIVAPGQGDPAATDPDGRGRDTDVRKAHRRAGQGDATAADTHRRAAHADARQVDGPPPGSGQASDGRRRRAGQRRSRLRGSRGRDAAGLGRQGARGGRAAAGLPGRAPFR